MKELCYEIELIGEVPRDFLIGLNKHLKNSQEYMAELKQDIESKNGFDILTIDFTSLPEFLQEFNIKKTFIQLIHCPSIEESNRLQIRIFTDLDSTDEQIKKGA